MAANIPIIDEATGRVVEESGGATAYGERMNPAPVLLDNIKSDVPFKFEDESTDQPFSFGVTTPIATKVEKTDVSKQELSLLASLSLGVPYDFIKGKVAEGDESLLREADEKMDAERVSQLQVSAEQGIQEAETPEDVVSFLKNLKERLGRDPTLVEQRAAYVGQVLEGGGGQESTPLSWEKLSPILRNTLQNNIIAADVQKQQLEYEDSYSFWDAAINFLEIAAPLTGAAEEEFSKYSGALYNRADELDNLPFEEKRALIENLVTAAKERETLLFNNNNSFINGGKIDTFYNSILQGGLNDPEGSYTDAERGALLETAFNGTIFVGEAVGLAKSTGNLIRFLMRRIHSSRVLKEAVKEEEILARAFMQRAAAQAMNPNRGGAHNLRQQGVVQEARIYEKTKDVREDLSTLASQKGTRKERKALEQEKRNLSRLEASTQNELIPPLARKLAKDKKIKFSEARKILEKEKADRLKLISNRKKINQELISDFDKRAAAEAEISRIGAKVADGRVSVDELQVGSGDFAVRPYGIIYRGVPQREGSHVLDVEFAFNPVAKEKIQQEKGIEGVQEVTGMSPEQVGERYLPTATPDTEIGFGNVPTPRGLTDAILADEKRSTIGMALGRELEKANGTSLTVDVSATRMREGTDDSTLGKFVFLLGDGERGGFKTLEEAEASVKQSALGYKSDVVQKDTGFYIEMEVEHYTNPFNDTKPLTIVDGTTPSEIVSWALNHGRVVEEELIRGLWALKGVNRSFVQKMEDKALKAIHLNPKKNALLQKMLEKGDLDEVEWFDRAVAEEVFGKIPDSVWKNYRSLREIYDEIYQVRESNYYNKLREGNMKNILLGGDLGVGLGRVVPKKEVLKDAKGKAINDGKVYDVESKQLIPLDEFEEGSTFVRLVEPIEIDGKLRAVIKVSPEKVKRLQRGQTLNKRAGHIDRMYEDAGWVVKQDSVKTVDGIVITSPRVSHIVKTEREAKTVQAKIQADGGEAYAIPSRENDELEFWSGDSASFGYGASHTKKRGEMVKGPNGAKTAGVLNAFESLFRSIGSVQQSLDYNVLRATEVKFFKRFEGILLKGDGHKGIRSKFENNKFDMVDREKYAKMDSSLRIEFDNHHQYLKTLRRQEYDAITAGIEKVVNKVVNRVGGEFSARGSIAGLQKATAEAAIVWNGLYQSGTNIWSAMGAIAADPVHGLRAVRMLASIVGTSLGMSGQGLAKMVGSQKLADELMQELKTNGLLDAVGRSNDFLDIVRTAGANVATTGLDETSKLERGLKTAGGVTKAVGKGLKEATMFPTARKLLVNIQEKPIIIGNALSYLTEFSIQVAKGKGAFDGAMKAEVSFQAQKRMLTQNSLDKFRFQESSNPISIAGQFLQAVYKEFLDRVVDPQWELVRKSVNLALKPILDRELGSIGKNRARVADTTGRAVFTATLVYAAIGPEGGLGKGIGSALEDYVRSQYKTTDDMPYGLDGFFNGMFSELINMTIEGDGKVDVGATFSPSAFPDMIQSLVLGEFPKVNLAGASGFFVTNVAESVQSAATLTYIAFGKGELEPLEAFNLIAQELTEPLKLMDSAQKAYIASMTLRNATSGSLSSEDRITQTEAGLSLVGLEPELLTDAYYRRKYSKGTDDGFISSSSHAKRNIGMGLQGYARQMAYEIDMGRMTRLAQQELYAKWVGIIKGITGEEYHKDIENSFQRRALKDTPAGWEGYVEGDLQGNTLEGIVEILRIKSQKAPEEAKETLNAIRESYERMREMDND